MEVDVVLEVGRDELEGFFQQRVIDAVNAHYRTTKKVACPQVGTRIGNAHVHQYLLHVLHTNALVLWHDVVLLPLSSHRQHVLRDALHHLHFASVHLYHTADRYTEVFLETALVCVLSLIC